MKNKGFISMLVVIFTTVVLTGGTIFGGVAVLKNNFDKKCGNTLNSWNKGDIYGDIADGDMEALDNGLKCREAVYDTVKKAKPVAALMSAAGNMTIDRKEFAQGFIVDRMMDLSDNLGNPTHKNPVRDSLLPPAVTKKLDEWKKEDEAKNKPKPVKENNSNLALGTHKVDFTAFEKQKKIERGAEINISMDTIGNIIFNFKTNKTLSCNIKMTSNITAEIKMAQISQKIKNKFKVNGTSSNCSGSLKTNGDFTFNGNVTSSAQGNSPGQKNNYSGGFTGSGFIGSDGKIVGDFTFKTGGEPIDFFE